MSKWFATLGGYAYDILAICISVLDVSTDVIVLIAFYSAERWVFFGLSLSIILLALLSYTLAFEIRYVQPDGLCEAVLVFVTMFPLSPLIPFFFYFAEKKESALVQLLMQCCWFDMYVDDWSIDDSMSKLRKFMLEKLVKHLGFVLEALVEAFPQAILQMVAIVVFKEANPIAITSIMISLLSVASKSLVFSVACALNVKQLLLNWLSAVTDFFGIFVVVCWCFYRPENESNDEELHHLFTVIQNVWLYKIYIAIFPFVGFCSLLMHVAGWNGLYSSIVDSRHDHCAYKFCVALSTFFVVTVLWVAGIVCSVLVFEITTVTWFAGLLFLCGTTRLPDTQSGAAFWFTLLAWVRDAASVRLRSYETNVTITKKEDLMIRLCSINNTLYSSNAYPWEYNADHIALKFLEQQCQETQYQGVKFSDLRTHSNNKDNSQFIRDFILNYYGHVFFQQLDQRKYYRDTISTNPSDYNRRKYLEYQIGVVVFAIITWGFGPIYMLSRFLTLVFPVFIVAYLSANDVFIWSVFMPNEEMVKIDLFQVIMITIYLFLLLVLSVMYVVNLREQYILYHFLPSRTSLGSVSTSTAKTTIKEIQNHYYGVITVPIRRAIVYDKFGDIGKIIISYLPADDHYEGIEDIVMAKTL